MNVKRKTSIKSIIPVSSMSDIAFLLLIFLMLSSILNMKKGPTITPPKAKEISTPEDARKYSIIIDKKGSVFLEDRYVTASEVTSFFSAQLLTYPNLFVLINADEEVTYDKVDVVVKALQEAKAFRLLFVCEKKNHRKMP